MILIELLLTFMKIGLFTIGGGFAMLPLIQEEVLAKGWMTASQLTDFIAVSESTPGPFAINAATYIGTKTAGLAGAVCATAGVVLPSFIIVLIAAGFYTAAKKSRVSAGFMAGLRPAVVGLIGVAAVSTAATVFFPEGTGPESLSAALIVLSVLITGLMLFLLYKKISPVFVILLSAGIGILTGYAGQLLQAGG